MIEYVSDVRRNVVTIGSRATNYEEECNRGPLEPEHANSSNNNVLVFVSGTYARINLVILDKRINST